VALPLTDHRDDLRPWRPLFQLGDEIDVEGGRSHGNRVEQDIELCLAQGAQEAPVVLVHPHDGHVSLTVEQVMEQLPHQAAALYNSNPDRHDLPPPNGMLI